MLRYNKFGALLQTDTRPERGPRRPNERVYAPKEWTRTRMREEFSAKASVCRPEKRLGRQDIHQCVVRALRSCVLG